MNYLLFTLVVVALSGIVIVIHGVRFYKRTGKLMGIGYVIIGLFLVFISRESYGVYKEALLGPKYSADRK